MNIDAIHLYTAADSSLGANKIAELGLSHVSPTDSYILQQANGLDVQEVAALPYGSYLNDTFFNQVPKERTIVLVIKLNPDYASGETSADLRDQLYKTISHSRTSLNELRFLFDGDELCYIRGYVTKFEADIFTPDPKVQISYRCPYFFLRGMTTIDVTDAPDVDVPDPIIEDYISTAPHGFFMRLEFTGTSADFTVKGRYGTDEWNFELNMPAGNPFTAGDVLEISSDETDKFVLKDGLLIIDRIEQNQVWPFIYPGETHLQFSSSLCTIEELTYVPQFWGI
jgi:hypothetical protein